MQPALLILRIGIICFGLVIYPAQLLQVLEEEAETTLPAGQQRIVLPEFAEHRERVLLYMLSTNNVLWLLYSLVINEWVIAFATTFNLCILICTARTKNRLRAAHMAKLYVAPAGNSVPYQKLALLT